MLGRALMFAVISLVVRAGEDPIPLPPRSPEAPTGRGLAAQILNLDLAERERALRDQVLGGNVPEFWRRFVEVPIRQEIEGVEVRALLTVAPDYLAVGSNDDYFLCPLSPVTAQSIADRIGCVLPTRRMVDAIYAAAAVRLAPEPIAPSPAMTTVPVFLAHHEIVWKQRSALLVERALGALVAGHKKDVVITPRLVDAPGKVAIYGWHRTNATPIQPLYLGHSDAWVDYSHGVRLVRREMRLNGELTTVEAVLADPKQCALLSDEGPVLETRYGGTMTRRTNALAQPGLRSAPAVVTNEFGERLTTLSFDPGVRVVIVEPAQSKPGRALRLVLYALPNGITIEQTIGRKPKPGDDWHFNIQHIGAQARWLREHAAETEWVVVFLECEGKAWPAWRRKHDPADRRIPEIVARLKERFKDRAPRVVLTGHSGGGSFTFGFLNGVERVPDDIERIAFLDSNYAYDAARGHAEKLAHWLKASDRHFLCVLAYHDSVALLDGKTFVSEQGGTWGRSHAMQRDLAATFPFVEQRDEQFQRYRALDGRVVFLLKENPDRAVLHTRQVEWNGFIHAMLTGTPREGQGYEYFGPKVYEAWVGED